MIFSYHDFLVRDGLLGDLSAEKREGEKASNDSVEPGITRGLTTKRIDKDN